MEIRVGPSDLELNQEKLLLMKEEYRRLCYEVRKKEQNKSSVHTKMQQSLRQQWKLISDFKKKKSELTIELRLQDSESFSNKSNQNLKNFKKSLEEVIQLEKNVKKQTEDLEKCKQNMLDLDKKMKQKQREVVKSQRSRSRALKHQRNITFLENRLNGSLHKYNDLLVRNSSLREDIISLLQTQSSFRRKYTCIHKLLSSCRKTLANVVNSATTSYQIGESVKYKLNLIKERTQVDQKKLGEKIKELKILVEQDKQMKEFLDFKMKERSSSDTDDSTAQKEQAMEEQLSLFQDILSRIQTVSGCQETRHICKVYLQGEDANLVLFEKLNERSLEIERLSDTVHVQRRELDTTTDEHREQHTQELTIKGDIQDCTKKLRVESQLLEDATDAEAYKIKLVKEVLHRVYACLDRISPEQVALSLDEGITDDNVFQCLESLERRVVDLMRCSIIVDLKHTELICDE